MSSLDTETLLGYLFIFLLTSGTAATSPTTVKCEEMLFAARLAGLDIPATSYLEQE